MKITEVRIFRREDLHKKLRAFAAVTLDGQFVVRDLKVIEGANGLFVAMPSRRMREPCAKCRQLVEVGSRFCASCGAPVEAPRERRAKEGDARQSTHRDIAHPITLACREYIQKTVLEAYERERDHAPQGQAHADEELDAALGEEMDGLT